MSARADGRAGLAIAWIAATVACGRGGAPRKGEDAAAVTAAPGWTVSRIGREPLASLLAIGQPLGAYADGDVMVFDAPVPRFRRVAPDGQPRWTVAWSGGFELGNIATGERDTWVVGRVERRLRVSPTVFFEAKDGGVTRPLVIARLDSRDGRLLAARFLDDANYWFAWATPLGDQAIVGASIDDGSQLPPFHLGRYAPDLELVAEARAVARNVLAADLQGDSFCVGLDVSPESDDERPTVHELWCLDRALRSRSRRPIAVGVQALWLDGDRIAAQLETDGNRLRLRATDRPDLIIAPRCTPPDQRRTAGSPAACPEHPLTSVGGLVVDGHQHAFLIAEVDLELGGVEVPISSPTVVILDFDDDGRARFSVHPECDAVIPLENERASLRCDSHYRVVSLAP